MLRITAQFSLALAVMCSLTTHCASTAAAQEIAATFNSTLAFNNNAGPFALGFQFNVSTPMLVTELGKVDIELDGLATDAQVALYNWNTGDKLSEGTILTSSVGASAGDYNVHYVDIPDVLLESGVEYFIATQVVAGDWVYESSLGEVASFAPPINFTISRATNFDPAIPTEANATTFSIMGSGFGGWFGPDFKFARAGDLNLDGEVNEADWPLFRNANHSDLSGLTPTEAFQMGDLDGDGDSDIYDFGLFQTAFDGAMGSGALSRLTSQVPEPSSGIPLLVGGLVFLLARGRRTAACICNSDKVSSAAEQLNRARENHGDNQSQCVIPTTESSPMCRIATRFPIALAFIGALMSNFACKVEAQTVAVTFDSTLANINTLGPFFLGYSFDVDSPMTLTEIGKVDVDGGGMATDAEVALYRLDTGAKLVQGTVLTTSIGESSGDYNSHFVDVPDVVLEPGIEYLLATQVVANEHMYGEDPMDIATFAPGINRIAGWATATGVSSVPGVANNSTFPIHDTGTFDSFYGPNFKLDNTPPPSLTIEVATNTGVITLLNDTNMPFEINYYEITSTGSDPTFIGSLDVAGWNSLQEQDYEGSGDPQNPPIGDGWEESGGVGPHALAESFLQGSSTLNPTDEISLGQAYNTEVDGQDLEFLYRVANGSIVTGQVSYVIAPGVEGDYNDDGVVNLADYTVWRDNLGASIALVNEDPAASTPGVVDQEDYTFWKSQFGATSGSGSLASAIVPEPTGIVLLLTFATPLALLPRRRHRMKTAI